VCGVRAVPPEDRARDRSQTGLPRATAPRRFQSLHNPRRGDPDVRDRGRRLGTRHQTRRAGVLLVETPNGLPRRLHPAGLPLCGHGELRYFPMEMNCGVDALGRIRWNLNAQFPRLTGPHTGCAKERYAGHGTPEACSRRGEFVNMRTRVNTLAKSKQAPRGDGSCELPAVRAHCDQFVRRCDVTEHRVGSSTCQQFRFRPIIF
jgi:hypothetical protein